MIRVVELERTCIACPAQWNGRTDDGRHVYVRYRSGRLQVGVGDSHDAAVGDDDTFVEIIGAPSDGFLEYDGLVNATAHRFDWPALGRTAGDD